MRTGEEVEVGSRMYVGQDLAIVPRETDDAARQVLTERRRNILLLHALEYEPAEIAGLLSGQAEPEPAEPTAYRRAVLDAVDELARPWRGQRVSRQYVRATVRTAQNKVRYHLNDGEVT